MSEDIERTLGRIEGKLDLLLDNFASHERLDNNRFADISGSLEKNAKWQGKIIGAGLAAGTIGGILAQYFWR